MIHYADDCVTLYRGDSLTILRDLAVVDHVITDAPYDAHTHKNGHKRNALGKLVDGAIPIAFDAIDPANITPILLAAARRWVITFCSMEMIGAYRDAAGPGWVRGGFWHRVGGSPQFSGDRPATPGECLAIMHAAGEAKRWNGGGRHAFYSHGVARRARAHPTEKPETIMLELIEQFTEPGETILDPFAGSGTTLVAAKRLGRKAIGIEMNAAYCDDAATRLAQGALGGLFS